MKLKKILQNISIKAVKGSKDVEISGIADDSRIVAPGNLFLPKKGLCFDGNDYIPEAIAAGAKAIVTDIYDPFIKNVVQIIVDKPEDAGTRCVNTFFQNPSQKINLIGITGTNGKTTTSYLIKHLLDKGKPITGLIGTVERIIKNLRFTADLTTPDCIQLHKILHEMILQEQKYAVMEVSSHGLSQNRVKGLQFDTAIFTNVSPEHLDYHKTFFSYKKNKEKLLCYLKDSADIVINTNDLHCKDIGKDSKHRRITYGINTTADYVATDVKHSLQKTEFTLKHKEKKYMVQTSLLGLFNVENVLAAIACVHNRGYSFKEIIKGLSTFSGVRGRLERIGNIFIDFAHTEDALRRVLEMFHSLKQGRIITLFGCGGNRDTEKRPKMAEVSEKFSDFVFVTSDNPRQEDPYDILQDIEKGFTTKNYVLIKDRYEAIKQAISSLGKKDILLIAGKGHETTQICNGQTTHFDDVEVVKEILDIVD